LALARRFWLPLGIVERRGERAIARTCRKDELCPRRFRVAALVEALPNDLQERPIHRPTPSHRCCGSREATMPLDSAYRSEWPPESTTRRALAPLRRGASERRVVPPALTLYVWLP